MGEMERIIEDILAGRRGAVARFYHKYAPILKNYLRGRIEREEDVEELLQDTLMSALESLPLYRKEARVKTFLFAIAKHEVADWYRKRYVRRVVEKTSPLFEKVRAEMASPEWEMKKNTIKRRFDDAYHSLSKQHQDVLSYRYELGMSVREMAKRMEMSLKATESLLYRARVAFRVAYEESVEAVG